MIFGVWQIDGKDVHFPAIKKGRLVQDIPPTRRKRVLVLRSKINPYEVPTFNEIQEQAHAKGLEVKDLIGKRLALKILVGKRYKIKSFRLFEAHLIQMCDCCGPEPFLRYRLNGKEYKGLRGNYKEV